MTSLYERKRLKEIFGGKNESLHGLQNVLALRKVPYKFTSRSLNYLDCNVMLSSLSASRLVSTILGRNLLMIRTWIPIIEQSRRHNQEREGWIVSAPNNAMQRKAQLHPVFQHSISQRIIRPLGVPLVPPKVQCWVPSSLKGVTDTMITGKAALSNTRNGSRS